MKHKKTILFLIFACFISLIHAFPPVPIQVYGDINRDITDGTNIILKVNDSQVGSGIINNNQYGYIPLIFLDMDDNETPSAKEGYAYGDTAEFYINNVKVHEAVFNETKAYKIDLEISDSEYNLIYPSGTQPPPGGNGGSGGGGIYVPPENHTITFPPSPQTARVRSGDMIFISYKGIQHVIKITRLSYQTTEMTTTGTPNSLSLAPDQEGNVDLDGDGTEDITITYKGVEQNRGLIQVSLIEAGQPPTQPAATCSDGIKNQGEEGVDCGGPCLKPCVEIPTPPPQIPEEPSNAWLYIIITALVLVIIGGAGFVFYEVERSHKSLGQEKQQKTLEDQSLARLESYVRQTLQMGFTKQQIRFTLTKEGWNPRIINNVLAKMR